MKAENEEMDGKDERRMKDNLRIQFMKRILVERTRERGWSKSCSEPSFYSYMPMVARHYPLRDK
ncbi:unnamed protein product [Sphenostylis stenocarpa]|uniref:Uncharacterized protein n=1 Tax=Sphenostylis stenocarpa TaxID=92480 RepID=A0AA86SHX6_9FABA|nr:unnamed protein product [Sphenostylis stenocarpa]